MELRRRDVLVGVAGLAAAGCAHAIKPRDRLNLMQGARLRDVVPARFGRWFSHVSDDLVKPNTEGTLAAKLYSDTLSRIYREGETGREVMVLMAYGSTQSDLLQLHRPETCYPAFGYAIRASAVGQVEHRGGAVPVRELVATGPARTESILYWTRIGDALPLNSVEQRMDKLRMAMNGYVPDGLLARFSVAGGSQVDFALLRTFAGGLLDAVEGDRLPALIGRGELGSGNR